MAGDPADRLGVHVIYAKAIGVAALLAVLAWAGHAAYSWAYDNGYNAAGVAAQKTIADFAKAEADAQAKARKAEQDAAVRVAEIAEQYERDKADAEESADRTIADLRAGAIRLRDEWAGCATDAVSATAAAAAGRDAAAAVRERAAAEVVSVGARADAQVRALQSVVMADRQEQ